MLEKLKSLLNEDQVFYGLLLALIAIGSFGLGKLSVADSPLIGQTETLKPVTITQNAVLNTVSTTTAGELVAVVASKSGSRYHLPTCPGAQQIKAENIIEFTSIAAATAAGYTPAANCPGL